MVCLNWAVLGPAIVCFHYSSFLSLHPAVRICNWLRNNPLWSDHCKRRHSLMFCHNKMCIPRRLVQLVCQSGNLWFFWIYIRSIWTATGKAPWHFHTHTHTDKENRQEKASAARVKLHDVTLSGLARPGRWRFVSKWRLLTSAFELLWTLISWVRMHLRSWNFGE